MKIDNSIYDAAYDALFTIYGKIEIKTEDSIIDTNLTQKKKDAVRLQVRRCLEKKFPGKAWDALSEKQQAMFICVDMKEYMFKKCVTGDKERENVEKKINEHYSRIIKNDLIIAEENKLMEKASATYYRANAPYYKNVEAYKNFCDIMSEKYPRIPCPDYDEWETSNKESLKHTGRPLRPVDYYESTVHEAAAEAMSDKYFASNSQIDHVITETLLKILKNELGIHVDVEKIRECIRFIAYYQDKYDHEPFDKYSIEPSARSEEEQDVILEDTRKYIEYKRMLDGLDFYTRNPYGKKKEASSVCVRNI